jgi:hypothetical protein
MAQKFLGISPAPTTDSVVGPQGRLTVSWERWFDRLPTWITSRPSCHVAHTANQALTTATWTILAFNSEDHDNATMHNTSTNNDRITIPSDGIYAFGVSLLFAGNATGIRWGVLSLNAATATPTAAEILAEDNRLSLSTDAAVITASGTRELSASDILRIHAYQSSGGDLSVLSSGIRSPRFWCFKV